MTSAYQHFQAVLYRQCVIIQQLHGGVVLHFVTLEGMQVGWGVVQLCRMSQIADGRAGQHEHLQEAQEAKVAVAGMQQLLLSEGLGHCLSQLLLGRTSSWA